MLKKLSLITSIFLFTFVGNAFAHTGLESSSPQNGEVIDTELKEITLTFEGKIEQSSTFTLESSTGESIPVDDIAVEDNILSGTLSTPLENGDYSVNWNIIGADGHLINGEVPFSVKMPASENTTVEQTDTEKTEVKEVETPSPSTNETAVTEEEPEQNASSYVVPTIIVILILIVVGSIFMMMKRKK
ncbi:copper resistance protein CopC [Ureibacillus sp. 179-F W5.1 NHS]|uniref:Copper resistance protein CopC n=1 Tax=Lysinibacillus halotolerans TaxID=1368476 RepID=A0A3M8H6K4_9BACI|nr:copper resistance CopC family protein [Lysinibacillus halotolerans]RNC97864.1 copper resistance protein CopC [Lysinibacillus halotolerans]